MSDFAGLRVSKNFTPQQNGAKRFTLRYGDSLVCVRHRLNETGTMRHTTVELLVESTPVASRARSLRISQGDKATRLVLVACGAQWQPKQRYWLLPRIVAKNLRLIGKIVPMSSGEPA